MNFDQKDVRVDLYSYGLTHDRVVRATHLPTLLEVTVDDERTIHRARLKALTELEALVTAYPAIEPRD